MADKGCALVTGAASGIGAATVRVLAEVGYRVAAADLPGKSVGGFRAEVDVSELPAVEQMIDVIEDELGPLTLLVNSAGILQEVPIDQISDADWQRMLAVHLGGTYNTCRTIAPRMRSRGGGVIVNVSSELALAGSTVCAHYCAAKGAIVGLTKALAKEFAPTVRVNSVAPGPTDTPMLNEWCRTEEYIHSLPTRRLTRPEFIAETIAFLASEDAAFFTGQVISPNSGAVI